MSERKFYRNVIKLVVLTEDEPLPEDIELSDIHYEVTEGHAVLHSFLAEAKPVTEDQMTDLLLESGSDPGFFRIGEPQD